MKKKSWKLIIQKLFCKSLWQNHLLYLANAVLLLHINKISVVDMRWSLFCIWCNNGIRIFCIQQQNNINRVPAYTHSTIHLSFIHIAYLYRVQNRTYIITLTQVSYLHKRSPKVSVTDSYEKRRECFHSLFLSYYKDILKGFVYSLNIYMVLCLQYTLIQR